MVGSREYEAVSWFGFEGLERLNNLTKIESDQKEYISKKWNGEERTDIPISLQKERGKS